MKKFISTEHEISVPAESVWSKIAKGDGVERWMPIIKSSRLAEGNRRYCEMHEGGKLEETILKSESTKTLLYSIDKQEAFPAKNMVGSMHVEPLGPDRAKLSWNLELDVDDEAIFSELKKNIEQVYQMSAAKLGE